MKRFIVLLASLVMLALPATASASIDWSGQTWNVFKATGNLGQVWSPTHVKVTNGVLSEAIYNNVSGGIGSRHWQTYGTYNVTFKMTKGGGKYAILLFGKGPHQEIDFAEGKPFDSNRTLLTGTLHWGTANNMIHVKTAGDFSQWHTAGVVWQPGKLSFTLDGRVWATITQHVPSSAMHETIQTSAHGGAPSTLYVSSAHIG